MNTPIKIYCIRHNATNRVYIGRSQRVELRVKRHLEALRGHRHIVEDMQADFDQHGDNYTISILEENVDCTDCIKEYQWMEKYQSHIRGKGYNYKDPHFNQKQKHLITYNGITKPLAQWADDMNLSYQTVYRRVVVLGWDVGQAFATPIRPCETYFKRMERLRNERNDQNRT